MRNFPHDHIINMEGVEDLTLFYGYGDPIVKYISIVIAFCKKNEFFHEDLLMKFFMINKRGFEHMWYEILGKGLFFLFCRVFGIFLCKLGL
jgi:hypothetical protein